jgi:hypothetical protein
MIIRNGLAMLIALSAQLLAGRESHASLPPFHSLLSENLPMISQYVVGENACGPTALLYAFKLGRKDMRDIYDKLIGSTDAEKLRSLIQSHGNKPSQTKYHRTRLEAKSGMAPMDMAATAIDLLSSLETKPSDFNLLSQSMVRRDSESAAGKFIARVHGYLKRSITNKVPVVSIVVPYMGTYKPEKNVNVWSEHTGHYVVITGVPETLAEGSLSFNVEYLDPATGRSNQALLFEEVERTFWAREEKGAGGSDWVYPEVTFNNRKVSSPFLVMAAPGLNVIPNAIKDAQRLVLAFTTAIGDFGSP